MSKDIVIQEQGVNQDLDDVEKLVIKKYGTSGTGDWLPEDETVLTPLTVAKNGTYTPGAGVYGFGTVQVRVQVVTGRIDGVLTRVTVDDNGYLVFTEVQEEVEQT